MFYILLSSFILSFLFIYMVRKVSLSKGFLSYPREDRWHKRPIALYGGIGIVLGIYITLLLFHQINKNTLPFLILSFFMFVIGLLDDAKPFPPSLKFILQIAITSFLIFSGGKIVLTGRFLPDVFITYLWVLGITNAFNLLDNIDGLSAGIGIIVAFILSLFFYITGSNNLFLIAIIGAYGAYLFLNFPPAKMFMGDAGSLFLGFSLSILSIPGYLNRLPINLNTYLAILLIFSIPIFDTILVTINRLYYGKRASEGGKDHTSHRLILLGFSERATDLILYTLSFFGGLLGIYTSINPGIGYFLSLLYVLSLFFFGKYLSKVKVYDRAPQGLLFLIEELISKVRASQIIVDTVVLGGAYYFAFFMHYEGEKRLFGDTYVATLPFVIFISLFFLFLAGIYKNSWEKGLLGTSFEPIEKLLSAIIFSNITIWLFTHYILSQNVLWEVLVTYSLIWFFLITFSRSILSYFDYLVNKVKERRP